METLNTIIREETASALSGIAPGFDDWAGIEQNIMQRVQIRIARANQAASKGDPKLPTPHYLGFDQVAQILNAAMTIRVIDDDNNDTRLLAVYNGEIYDTSPNVLYVAATALNSKLGKRDLDEIIARLMLMCEHVELNKDRDLIAVNNGIFDFKKKKLMPFDEKYVFLSKSHVSYNKGARLKTFPDGWNVEDWMRDISVNDEVCTLLWETVGSVLRPYVRWNKTVWLYSSEGNNGKGTYCQLLRNLLGPKAHCSIPIADFSKDYALVPLVGKQAIITDENDVGRYIDQVALMKAVVTGDIITITKKYEQPINYRFRGMMVQCLNGYPKVKDKSDSFYRRQIFVPFEKSFEGVENKAIKETYLNDPDVLEYVLYKVLNADYYSLSEPDVCKSALTGYKDENDPIRQFWNEFENMLIWELVPYKFLFDLYRAWYDQNFPRSQQLSYTNFIRAIKLIVKRESHIWACDDDNAKHRVGTKMSQPEPLIVEYELKQWYSKTYSGKRDMRKMCTLTQADLAASYMGIYKRKYTGADKPKEDS